MAVREVLRGLLRPAKQCVGNTLGFVQRDSPAHYQHAGMREKRPVELARPMYVVVAVARHEDPPVNGRSRQLLVVREAAPAQFVDARHIEAESASYLRDARAQVFVEQETHDRGTTSGERG